VRQFLAGCEAKFGSTNCEKLIGCRLDTPEGHQFFQDHNLRERCTGFVREARGMVADALAQA